MDYEKMIYVFKKVQREYEAKTQSGYNRQYLCSDFIMNGALEMAKALDSFESQSESDENIKDAKTLYNYYCFSIQNHILHD